MKINKKRVITVNVVITIVFALLLVAFLCIGDIGHKKNSRLYDFKEIKPAVEDEDFAVGVIKATNENAFDTFVVKDMKTGEDISLPSNLTTIKEGQDAGEMRGGVIIIRDGFGNIVSCELLVPADMVMREYSGV